MTKSSCLEVYTGDMMGSSNQLNQFKNGDVVFFILKNGSICSGKEPAPKTFYVKGHVDGGHFVAEGDVQGDGSFASAGRPGWIEIPSGQFYSMETARGVVSPYVNGYMTDGGFVPSSKMVR